MESTSGDAPKTVPKQNVLSVEVNADWDRPQGDAPKTVGGTPKQKLTAIEGFRVRSERKS